MIYIYIFLMVLLYFICYFCSLFTELVITEAERLDDNAEEPEQDVAIGRLHKDIKGEGC